MMTTTTRTQASHRIAMLTLTLTLALTVSAAAAAAEPTAADPSAAEPTAAEPSAAEPHATRLRADVELDPTAYVLDGYSLHLGVAWRRLRVDLGAFALTVPELVHGQDGFTASFDGFGAKLQLFLRPGQTGAFAGVDAGVVELLVRRDGTDLASRGRQATAGVHVGWRQPIVGGMYATAWIGVGRVLGARTVELGGARFEQSPWTVFPAIHLGYRFR
jgi:hypothetical protein